MIFGKEDAVSTESRVGTGAGIIQVSSTSVSSTSEPVSDYAAIKTICESLCAEVMELGKLEATDRKAIQNLHSEVQALRERVEMLEGHITLTPVESLMCGNARP